MRLSIRANRYHEIQLCRIADLADFFMRLRRHGAELIHIAKDYNLLRRLQPIQHLKPCLDRLRASGMALYVSSMIRLPLIPRSRRKRPLTGLMTAMPSRIFVCLSPSSFPTMTAARTE